MKQKFKEGDRIKLVRHGKFGWEHSKFTETQLNLGQIYTVSSIGKSVEPFDIVNIGNAYHPNHFEFARQTNEERIARRRAELTNK